jgi:hypothetical protein
VKRYEFRECICGCKENFFCRKTSNQRYILGHNAAGSRIENHGVKEYISNLSDLDRSERMKKSAWKCDHEKRGKSISEGKKGKKTNQQEIMGRRYVAMSDDDFLALISTFTRGGDKRAANLREKWKKILSSET